MKRTKNDEHFVSMIIKNIDYILSILEGVDFETFSGNQMMSDSTVFRLVQISEHCSGLSEEFKETVNYDWFMVTGMRNRLVHDYGNVDFGIVYSTAKKDLPMLRSILNDWMATKYLIPTGSCSAEDTPF